MSELQRDLVSNEPLATCGFSHDLDGCVITNAGHVGRISERMMATAVEAIVGAVFKDSGFDPEAVRTVMARLGFFKHQLLANTDCKSLAGHTNPTPEA
jgi:ribonuclease-3